MATTIMEALSGQTPKGYMHTAESRELLNALVKVHLAEIEEARAMGYSWRQIERACKAAWNADARGAKVCWSKHEESIRVAYHALKGDINSSHKAVVKMPPKKYSVEVTEG